MVVSSCLGWVEVRSPGSARWASQGLCTVVGAGEPLSVPNPDPNPNLEGPECC